MGFRDLTHFNKALLAKQVWRIIEKPDSLVARIFKARYFKHLDIMDAPIGNNPSFIWRSMMWSKDVLNMGLIWKIGNDSNINARRDAWIPSLKFGRVSSNVCYESNIIIDKLLSEQMFWDVDLLKTRFLPYEVEAIRRIPIAGSNHPDSR